MRDWQVFTCLNGKFADYTFQFAYVSFCHVKKKSNFASAETSWTLISGKPCWHCDIRCRRGLFCREAVWSGYRRQGDLQWWWVCLASPQKFQHVPSAPRSECVCALVCVHRGLYSVCSSGEEQQFGHRLPAGPEELSQRHSLDRRLESTAGVPAVPQLPELV